MKSVLTITFRLAYFTIVAQPFEGIRTPNDTLKSVELQIATKSGMMIIMSSGNNEYRCFEFL